MLAEEEENDAGGAAEVQGPAAAGEDCLGARWAGDEDDAAGSWRKPGEDCLGPGPVTACAREARLGWPGGGGAAGSIWWRR